MTLYETLDTIPDASPNEIKKAYKRKAKETHPDAGGTSDKFAKVSRAYLVLSDPVKRARYDETGDISENVSESYPLNLLVQFFVTIVMQHAVGQGPDPCTIDLVKLARDQFREDILAAENEQVKVRKQIKLWEKVAAKFSKHDKKTPDTIRLSLLGQVPRLEQQLRVMTDQIQIRKDATKLLDGYRFDFETSAPLASQAVWRFTNIA